MGRHHSGGDSGTRPAVREHCRIPAELAVTFELAGGGIVEGVARDLSLGGAFIEASELPAFGESVVIELHAPGGGRPLRLSGVVRWGNATGFGMQFGLLGARETHVMVQLLGALRDQPADDGSRASNF